MSKNQKTTGQGGGSPWCKTQFANILRHKPSGGFYARLRVKGKLIWRSLDTDRITIAKSRLKDKETEVRKQAEAGQINTRGAILFEDAIDAYRDRGFRPITPRTPKDARPLKPAAVAYYEQRINSLSNTWPGFGKLNITRLTRKDCERWADKARREMAPTVFNHALGVLRNLIDYGIEAGARYDNPARGIMRESESPKVLELPDADTFQHFLEEIENGGSGFSKPCADLVRFLAFGGFRLGEAKFITWQDCDFINNQITLRGHPETGLKNRKPGEVRHVPMIPEMKELLQRLREERPAALPEAPVMAVHECQRAMNRAALAVGMKRITHHDLRHLFATRCIESGVDIPTVSRWLGHRDGGALAMRVYGHLRDQHSMEMARRVMFAQAKAANVVELPKQAVA